MQRNQRITLSFIVEPEFRQKFPPKGINIIFNEGEFRKFPGGNMKITLFVLLFSQIALAGPEVILSNVDHLYVPEGFDSNDSIEVVVTGTFPNPCFARNNVIVEVKDASIDLTVTALAPYEKGDAKLACPDMVVPFKEVVSIGNLQGGVYDVRVNDKTQTALNDKLNVTEAESRAVDDNIYAAIDRVEKKSETEYVLHGWRYSMCVDLKTIKVVTNNKDTLSILPIMTKTADVCPMKGMPTEYAVTLDFSTLKMKKPLLHVRTMDGKSVNTVLNVQQ
jgi:hypothetical protein